MKISRIDSSEVKEYLEYVQDAIAGMTDYIREVCKYEIGMTNLGALKDAGLIEPSVYRDKAEGMDEARSSVHNNAISQMKILNSICEKAGVEHIYPDPDTTHRYDCGSYFAAVTTALFYAVQTGQMTGLRQSFSAAILRL